MQLTRAEMAARLGVPEGQLTYEGRQERKLNRKTRRKLAQATKRQARRQRRHRSGSTN